MKWFWYNIKQNCWYEYLVFPGLFKNTFTCCIHAAGGMPPSPQRNNLFALTNVWWMLPTRGWFLSNPPFAQSDWNRFEIWKRIDQNIVIGRQKKDSKKIVLLHLGFEFDLASLGQFELSNEMSSEAHAPGHWCSAEINPIFHKGIGWELLWGGWRGLGLLMIADRHSSIFMSVNFEQLGFGTKMIEGVKLKIGDERWKMEDGRWKMGDGRWWMKNGRLKVEDGRWKMGDGRLRIEEGKLKIEDGVKMENRRWKMEDGRWKMEDGRWKMEDGRWKIEDWREYIEDDWRGYIEDWRWKMEDGRWKMEEVV